MERERPPSSAARRPPSGVRPLTSRGIAATVANGAIPGTASRLVSAATANRPASRISTVPTNAERPITQQGIHIPRPPTGSRMGSQRLIQDKSYFVAVIRSKMSDISTEIHRLRKNNAALIQDQSSFLALEKNAENMAAELKELQGELADYNLLLEKLHNDVDAAEVHRQYQSLKAKNEAEAKELDEMFERRQETEARIRALEREIEQERHMADNIISTMKPEIRNRYAELQSENIQLVRQLDDAQEILENLQTKQKHCQEEISSSYAKQEAVKLYERLREVESKRQTMIEEQQSHLSPNEEREKLLQQAKQDNEALSVMERSINELNNEIASAQEQLLRVDEELDDQHSERAQKYRELKKREETIDAFLDEYETSKAAELERQQQLLKTIEHLKQAAERKSSMAHNLPTRDELSEMRENLEFNRGETEKSQSTVSSLDVEQRKLASDLLKIEQLETKVRQELEGIRGKMKTMHDEIVVFEDLEQLKVLAESKRVRLENEKKETASRKSSAKQLAKEAEEKLNAAKLSLEENEMYTKLTNLEKRWEHIEQNNFVISEFIVSRMAEHNYHQLQSNVLNMINSYNKMIQDAYNKTPN